MMKNQLYQLTEIIDLLVNNKDRTNKNNSGVYEISCYNCEFFYIGCTGRSFKNGLN